MESAIPTNSSDIYHQPHILTSSFYTLPRETPHTYTIRPRYVEGTDKKRIMFATKVFSLEIGEGDCITFNKEGTIKNPIDTNIYTAKVKHIGEPIKNIEVRLYNSDTGKWNESTESIPLPGNSHFGAAAAGQYNTIVKLDTCPSELGSAAKGGKRRKHTHKKRKSKRKTHRKRR